MNRPCWRNSAELPSVADPRRPRVTERRDDPAKRRFSYRIHTVRHHCADLSHGASGAISGVLGAYLMLFPRANILTLVLLAYFFTTLRVSAMLLLLLWLAIQLLGDLAMHGDAAAAYRAHIAGFLAGMLLVVVFKRRTFPLFAR